MASVAGDSSPATASGWKATLRAHLRQDAAWRFLAVLLFVFLIKQLLLVVIFPPFTGHDEVAHFTYIQTVATEGRVPELLVDDIPDEFYRYCQYILDWTYDPCGTDDPRWADGPPRVFSWGAAGNFDAGEQYVANHPPLYYLLGAPLYLISDFTSIETQQYLIRMLSIPFGLLTVFLAFLTARLVFPGDRFIAIVASTFVAFQPQISYEASMVNHDILGIAAISLILCLLARGMRSRFLLWDCVVLGLALGIAMLIKGNTSIVAPIIALAMIMAIGWRNVSEWVCKGAVVAGLGGLLAAPWYLFLWRTYGSLDALDQVEEMQRPWNFPAGTFTDQLFNRSYVWARWQESWGAFGWRRIQLTDWLLWLIAIPVILALVGLLLLALRGLARRRGSDFLSWLRGYEPLNRLQVQTIVLYTVLFVISYLAIIQFGTRFRLTQSRYLFPTVNAVAIGLALGARTLVPPRLRPYAQGAIVSALILLTLVIYTKFVIPYWHLTDWDLQ
ncbi:MAG: glycosyltransferase family 39 protein [Thermomicrobiales bacterium]|nr:glycosyltransferase family 39 protein [Thermomicrobiales bacterium]